MRAISRIYLFLCACGLYCSLLLLYMTYNYKSCLFLQCYCIISLTVVEWNAFLLILFAKFLPFSFCPTFKSFSFFCFVCLLVCFILNQACLTSKTKRDVAVLSHQVYWKWNACIKKTKKERKNKAFCQYFSETPARQQADWDISLKLTGNFLGPREMTQSVLRLDRQKRVQFNYTW